MYCEYQYSLLVLTVSFYCYTTLFTVLGIVELQLISNLVVFELCGQVYVSVTGSLSQFSTKIQVACCVGTKTDCNVFVFAATDDIHF
jgi:hypothetical protein